MIFSMGKNSTHTKQILKIQQKNMSFSYQPSEHRFVVMDPPINYELILFYHFSNIPTLGDPNPTNSPLAISSLRLQKKAKVSCNSNFWSFHITLRKIWKNRNIRAKKNALASFLYFFPRDNDRVASLLKNFHRIQGNE